MNKRTSPRKKALQLAKYLRSESPDYGYLRTVFMYLRQELEVAVTVQPKKLPYVPTEDEIQKYYDIIWKSKNIQDIIIIKVLIYTGIRVSELVRLKKPDVDLNGCQIRIIAGKGKKDRIVPFPKSFRETLAMYITSTAEHKTSYLFESSWKKPYSDRGIRRILEKYSNLTGMQQNISPHKLRHFLFTWLKKRGIDDALIQPYSGHETRKSLEIYSKLSLSEAQKIYEENIKNFPV
ncbi:MAG: tyrosine-type recombinase/integrase [Rickettsia endosymbiont of Ixodes persulcatus]|nr:tyrosine-type recombinase/integrase [Rickettsia endosymbiont of Ixodes persulcatus]MCZ6909273.1 tyrosine-type recombinase/integrase [Rickettsia endosymbiont of Ixodes persulcatus]MCZ6910102.1 tyrosine-type recombinase/integrase [Rickettsia endosymbiont of Ixodes persulcatus]MCZ6914343.1 tyrosine-type recombinase/integrase [Rickettsia endosymbiont of Ixodes persulcatus]MCZ6919674.1 tyrosine-type recombinase/integrase [Rickettsia endosymbiont of Ixodes persulcatus]